MRRRRARAEASASPADLEARLAALESEVQELRALGFRVAELADLVTELLAWQASAGDPEFARIVERYRREV